MKRDKGWLLWERACHGMGGHVETRYEYTRTDVSTDSKGNVSVTTTPVYSYHCWVNGQEVDPK